MADINKRSQHSPRVAAPAANEVGTASDTALLELIELLFFAYRDFTGDPDAILGSLGFGRAHHRVLHFVGRYPGMRVADLLDILKITKQSLARVLKQLIDEGYVEQQPGTADRRERRLHLTERGRGLAARLLAPQLQRMQAALHEAGDNAMTDTRLFLYNMINRRDRKAVGDLFQAGGASVNGDGKVPRRGAAGDDGPDS